MYRFGRHTWIGSTGAWEEAGMSRELFPLLRQVNNLELIFRFISFYPLWIFRVKQNRAEPWNSGTLYIIHNALFSHQLNSIPRRPPIPLPRLPQLKCHEKVTGGMEQRQLNGIKLCLYVARCTLSERIIETNVVKLNTYVLKGYITAAPPSSFSKLRA